MKRNSYLPLAVCTILGSTLAATGCHSNGSVAAAGGGSGTTASIAAAAKPKLKPMPKPASHPSRSAASASRPSRSAASAASASPVAHVPAAVPRVVGDCVTPRVRPKVIVISCADGGLGFEKMTWSRWGAATASGQGDLYENLCEPSCAEGTIATYPVLVTLSRVKFSSHGAYFSELTVTWEGRKPRNSTPDSFPLMPPAA